MLWELGDAVWQALTWSDYKKSNTAKFLIPITPDGFINYISPGSGGQASDVEIVQKSGYLDLLPEGASILADRGFKHIETILRTKKCKLFRPPSVSANVKSSELDVVLIKQIASVRT